MCMFERKATPVVGASKQNLADEYVLPASATKASGAASMLSLFCGNIGEKLYLSSRISRVNALFAGLKGYS